MSPPHRQSRPVVAVPYAGFSGTISQMLRPFPQYSSVADVYGNVARSTYHSLQLTLQKRRSDDGLTVNFNYTYSRTEDNQTARTGYDFDQDWAVSVNDQPHVWNALVVYNLPFGAEGRPGSGNRVVRAIVKDWQVSGITQFRSGRPLGAIGAACNLPNAGTCYADYNPTFSGEVRINGDYGDGDVLGANPPAYIDRTAFQSPAPFTFGNTPRTLAFDLRNPHYINQDLSIRRDFPISGSSSASGSTSSMCSTPWSSAGFRPTSPVRTSAGWGRRPTRRAWRRSSSAWSSEEWQGR